MSEFDTLADLVEVTEKLIPFNRILGVLPPGSWAECVQPPPSSPRSRRRRRALFALAGGATIDEAAVAAGIGTYMVG